MTKAVDGRKKHKMCERFDNLTMLHTDLFFHLRCYYNLTDFVVRVVYPIVYLSLKQIFMQKALCKYGFLVSDVLFLFFFEYYRLKKYFVKKLWHVRTVNLFLPHWEPIVTSHHHVIFLRLYYLSRLMERTLWKSTVGQKQAKMKSNNCSNVWKSQ